MEAKIIETNGNFQTVEIQIPKERVEKELNKIYREIVNRYNIPGFRKGKAPRKVVEMRIGKDVFYSEAQGTLINESFPQALKDLNLNPVGYEFLEVNLEADQPMTYKVKMEFEPVIESLENYKNAEVELERGKFEFKEEYLTSRLEELRTEQIKIKAVEEDRELKENDTAIIDYCGSVDGVEFEGGTASDHSLKIGSNSFIPGFETQCIGMKKGEEKVITVTFPEEYHEKSLAGKDAQFKVKLNDIKEEIIPKLDDDFAKAAGDHETLQELKDQITKEFNEHLEDLKKSEVTAKALEKIAKDNNIDAPEAMINNEIDRYIEEYEHRIRMQMGSMMPDISLEKFLSFRQMTIDDFRNECRPECERAVKNNIVLKTVANIEKIELSDTEYNKEVEKVAESMKKSVDEFEKMLKDNGTKDIFMDNLKKEKAKELIYKNASITEIDPPKEENEAADQEKSKKTDKNNEKEVEA